MTSPEGGFFSAGQEGSYYTFTPGEILAVLGKVDGKRFNEQFDITEGGNFNGMNIPNLLKNDTAEGPDPALLSKLRQYRAQRTPLLTDRKNLTAWNAMAIAALCLLYRATKNRRYLDAALSAQAFIERSLGEGETLFTARRDDKRGGKGFLDDYTWACAALTELYHSTLDKRWLEQAENLFRSAHGRFTDRREGGYFQRESQDDELFLNPKEDYDGAIPSGNAVMAYDAIRLSQLTEDKSLARIASAQIRYLSGQAEAFPPGHCFFLLAKLLYENPPAQIRIVKRPEQPIPDEATGLFLANVTVVPPSDTYPQLDGAVTYYVCKDHVCLPPSKAL